jgi:enamine deaminase RidA (YjgF/YER057c/UK114 family)
MQRQNVFDGTEVAGGYARAVRVGRHIHVSGTTSLDKNGNAVGKDVYEQTRETYRKIATALEKCGAGVKDIVRVTSYIVDMKQLPGFQRGHLEAMGGNTPASSLIGTNALLKPELLIEIEAYAINRSGTSSRPPASSRACFARTSPTTRCGARPGRSATTPRTCRANSTAPSASSIGTRPRRPRPPAPTSRAPRRRGAWQASRMRHLDEGRVLRGLALRQEAMRRASKAHGARSRRRRRSAWRPRGVSFTLAPRRGLAGACVRGSSGECRLPPASRTDPGDGAPSARGGEAPAIGCGSPARSRRPSSAPRHARCRAGACARRGRG